MNNPIQILRGMIQDLENHQRDKKTLLSEFVQARLDLSIKNYYEDLMKTYESITRRDAAKVITRAFNKEGK